MFNIQKNIKNNNGDIEIISITSNDNYKTLEINKTYKLVKNTNNKENKIEKSFKNSILGLEVGINAYNFSKITILATIIAIGTVCFMYAFWRI